MLPVVILAGGLATRLRPITETLPKALIEINGEPFLAHQLRLLRRSGITRVVLCIGYRGEQIEHYAADGSRFGLEIAYSYDGAKLMGTAGAIRKALPLLDQSFFVLYGDSYLLCDYHDVERAFLQSGKQGLMTVFRNVGHWDASNVEFSNGLILRYDKVNRTPRMHHIDYGLGAFHADAFTEVSVWKPLDLAAVYQDLLRRGELAAYVASSRFYEIGSTAGIRELAQFLSEPSSKTPLANST